MEKIDWQPHLVELKKKFLQCVLVFALTLLPLLFFSREWFSLVAQPLRLHLPQHSLIATDIATPFTIPLKLALFSSFVLTVPYSLYQIWAFVSPGLFANEKRILFPVLFFSILLFYLGMLFAHFVVLPMALTFFVEFSPIGVTMMTDIKSYYDFILALYIAFGLSFQVPIITFVLIYFNVVRIEMVKKYRAFIIVSAFVLGMLLTPPDVVSQILLAIPLYLLFESGVLLAKHFKKQN